MPVAADAWCLEPFDTLSVACVPGTESDQQITLRYKVIMF
jgi:hypothetical protein